MEAVACGSARINRLHPIKAPMERRDARRRPKNIIANNAFLKRIRFIQPICNPPPDCLDIAVRRSAGKLGADLPDMFHDRIAASASVQPPDKLIDPLTVKNLSGIHGEQLNNVKFPFGERNTFPVQMYGTGGIVDGQIPEKTHRSIALPPLLPPQMRGDPGAELIQVKGLYDIVIGPGLETDDLIRGLNTRRQK